MKLGKHMSQSGELMLIVDHISESGYYAVRVLRKDKNYWIPEYASVNMNQMEFDRYMSQ